MAKESALEISPAHWSPPANDAFAQKDIGKKQVVINLVIEEAHDLTFVALLCAAD
jgi:hypothetical protein